MKFQELQIGQFFRPQHPHHDDTVHLRVPPWDDEEGRHVNYYYKNFDVTGVPFYAWGRLDDEADVILVEQASGLAALDTHLERCRHCQDLLPLPCLDEHTESYYDWDNPDEDTAGSVLLSRTYYACRDQTQCLANRRETAKIMQEIAKQQDGTMREAGWGAIGNSARGSE